MKLRPEASDSRRVTLVSDELLGYVRTGGLGTATSFLALALARMGHQIELLYAGGQPATPLGDEWARLYDRAGVAIRMLPHRGEAVEPPYFARMRQAELALAADPPDVVITQDLAAPCYTALRLRQLGLAFEDTLFVVWFHGTRQWITDTARKVRVLPGALAITELERASIELADIVVSPSAYMLDWMRRQGWRLPETNVVIPLLTRSGATGEPPPEPVPLDGGGRVARIAVFGRLEERKGLRPFVAGLNALEPELLEGLELEFVGRATPAWPAERVEGLLSERVRRALARVSFLTDLDQPEALARLRRPQTLALMPSLEDNSPNTVYECLERGIPFIASRVGGIGELVASEDRVRVLFEPTPEGIAEALRRVLSADALEPARPAFDDATSPAAVLQSTSSSSTGSRPRRSHAAWRHSRGKPTASSPSPSPSQAAPSSRSRVRTASPASASFAARAARSRPREKQAFAREAHRGSSSSTRRTCPRRICSSRSSGPRARPEPMWSHAGFACRASASTCSRASRADWDCSRTATAPSR